MIGQIIRGARWLDEWLQERLGRPYNVILGIGLVSEIVEEIGHLGERVGSAPTLVRSLLTLLVAFALLLHQVGALSDHFERRGAGRRNGRTRS
jgi:hypothetical protein